MAIIWKMYFVDPSKKRIDIEINGAQDFCHSFVLPEINNGEAPTKLLYSNQ
ncbi:MAG: hypothetical protein WA126_10555 [Thermodesulfovibrionales bacterium]